MKINFKYFVLALLAGATTFQSCIDYDDATEAATVKVQLVMPETFIANDFEGHDITITSEGSSQRIIASTDNDGIATFSGIIPDIYNIATSWEITSDEYRRLTGDSVVTSGCTITGALNSQLLTSEYATTPLKLQTTVSVNRDIIISKIYAAGSKDQNNRSYQAGKYIELYNQSGDTINAAGLYIGLLDSDSSQPYTLDNLSEDYDDSVVVAKQVFRIPDDDDCLLPPEGTLLICNSAIDHSDVSDFENDLSGADFEAKDLQGSYVNNPATPALELIYSMYSRMSIMNLVQSGPCGIVIFRTTEDVSEWPLTYAYGKTSGNQYMMIPVRTIIDGVDYLRNKTTGVDTGSKRLYPSIDAGYININAISGWTGEVVYRKTAKTENGRKVLTDTNNSSNDFHVSTTITPREYD